MGKRIAVIALAVSLIFFATLSLVLWVMLTARTFDSALIEGRLRERKSALYEAPKAICPTKSIWIEAYKKNNVDAEYVRINTYTDTTPADILTNDAFTHVLRETDYTNTKFSRNLLYFDRRGCLI